jgi:hypothetical protein
MAGFAAIAATGRSIERYLATCFAELQPVSGSLTRVVLTTTGDLDTEGVDSPIAPLALSIFLYRVDFNKTMRAAWSGVGTYDGRSRLPLDLHYLLTAWADNAEHEHLILGRAMQCLESTPVLGGPLLLSSGGWTANECVQLALEDIPTEALMRTFDSLPVKYRLSVPYVARVVRIDGLVTRPDVPVVEVVTGLVPAAEA